MENMEQKKKKSKFIQDQLIESKIKYISIKEEIEKLKNSNVPKRNFIKTKKKIR